MLQNQIAGRHGSYATQFWKASAGPQYRTRGAMRAAYSRKAVDRRLVLPLDSHNWIRALEVLDAGYARLGRTPQHFQTVLRDMVGHHGPYATLAAHAAPSLSPPPSATTTTAAKAAEIVPAIDALRDRAYAGEIPTNASLWVTFVWSYCTLQQPHAALETFHQARRRFRLSTPTLQHMAELLLPVLCRHGQLEEATALYEEFLSGSATQAHRSRMEDAEARRWLAEAAARQGDWERTQQLSPSQADARVATQGGKTAEMLADTLEQVHRPTINSLFHPRESSATVTPPVRDAAAVADADAAAKHAGARVSPRLSQPHVASPSLPVLATLSRTAVHQLLRSICQQGAATPDAHTNHVADALQCWEHLYGPVPGVALDGLLESQASPSSWQSETAPPPPRQDMHGLLNLLASHQHWEAALGFFSVLFLHQPASVYLAATPHELHRPDGGACSALLQAGGSRSADLVAYLGEVPLDEVTLNLVFTCLPTAAEPLCLRSTSAEAHGVADGRDSRTLLLLRASARPATVARLLNDLLLLRDDMVLTDYVMAVAGPALLQLGQTDRVFELLARCPMMVAARNRKAAVHQDEELKKVLVSLGYAAYALCDSPARRHDMVRCMPHLFPPEVVRRFAAAQGKDEQHAQRLAVLEGPLVPTTEGDGSSALARPRDAFSEKPAQPTRSSSQPPPAPSMLDLRWHAQHSATRASSSYGEGGHASLAASSSSPRLPRGGRTSSSAILTARADEAMRADLLRLQQHRHDAFTGSHADAERDPRPIPKGLHDHASGWDFFGRGGEKAFANHKRTPHPFTMQPKVMRDLRNPYRGWSPRQNSSLAHKENVIKWNGKSAV